MTIRFPLDTARPGRLALPKPDPYAEKPSKIRVVHLVYSFATGGMEKGICTTVRSGSRDFEHVIVCLTAGGAMVQRLPEGTRVIAMGKRPGNSPRFLLRLARVFRKLRPAVVHTRNWSGMDGVLAAKIAGIRAVVHGEHGWGLSDPFGVDPKRRIIRKCVDPLVNRYTCVSKQMAKWLKNTIGVRKHVCQIYNGIDTQRFFPVDQVEKYDLRLKFGLPITTPIIGVVARLDPIKDHRSLFKAFQIIRPHFPNIKLLVVGDGPEASALKASAGEGVRFTGRCDDIEAVYRCLDLFVLPSSNEGISNTVLEAMASGLPVLASRVGGTPELITEEFDGLLFPAGDVEVLAQKMAFYLQNPRTAENHGRQARKTVAARFSIEEMVSAYERVWMEALNS